MKIGKLRLVLLVVFCMVFLLSSFGRSSARGPSPVQQILLDLPPDPEGQSVPTVTLTNSSGDPAGVVSAGYMLDDGSVVVNMAGTASGSQSLTYQISVDDVSNSYSVTNVSTQEIPPCIAGSARLSTIRKADGTEQVRTVDRLKWRVLNGTVGFTSWDDLYQTINGGGLTWNIRNSPVDPPYTISPVNASLFNDTGNGKYKNFNFGDPALSTIVVHFVRIDKEASDPDNIFRWETSHKVVGEGVRKFKGEVRLNQDITAGCT
jgi:hypothetical protein